MISDYFHAGLALGVGVLALLGVLALAAAVIYAVGLVVTIATLEARDAVKRHRRHHEPPPTPPAVKQAIHRESYVALVRENDANLKP